MPRRPPPPTSRTPGGDPVLAARFAIPALPQTFVRRPRLVRRLREAVRHPLTVVSGPAGAGKTLLVADWAAAARADRRPGRVVWLTVERTDDAPGVFWAYTLAALRHHGVPLPAGIGSPARASAVDPSLLTRLAAHLSRPAAEPVLVVLDEFDRAASTEGAAELDELVRHSAPGLRLVLICRSEPLLPLHRYRAAGEVLELRAEDLEFTPGECAELLNRHGVPLPDEGVRALTARTGGWAAGIRLAALAAQRAADPEGFLKSFEAGHSTMADFLISEVLQSQPAPARDLLLRISVLDLACADLADALTGRDDAEDILSDLYRANAFVTRVAQDRDWYRLNPLFAEVLRVYLRARHPGLDAVLHRRAARWLAGAGHFPEALPHAVAAGDWDLAVTGFSEDLIVGRLFAGLDAGRLVDLLSRLPTTVGGPAAELVRAACGIAAAHDRDGALAQLREADRATEAAPTPAFRLTSAFLHVKAARALGSAQLAQSAADQAAALRRDLPEALLDERPELAAQPGTDLGCALLREGMLDAARGAFGPVADMLSGPYTAACRVEALGGLALVELVTGWHRKAAARARAALQEAELAALTPGAPTGLAQLVLAAVAVGRDESALARAAVAEGERCGAAVRDEVAAVGWSIVRSRLLVARGELRAAREVLDEAASDATTPWLADRWAQAAAAVHLAAGDGRSALAVLARTAMSGPECAVLTARAHLAAADPAEARTALDLPAGLRGFGPAVTAPVLAVRAHVADLFGEESSAVRLLSQALTTARPELLRRPFREDGAWLRAFLHRHPALAQTHDWLPAELVADLPRTPPEPARTPAVGTLTERELDVLRCVAQMMSTEEMAADLHLSANTIKTHLKSINRKLMTTRRGEAVRRARELHLL